MKKGTFVFGGRAKESSAQLVFDCVRRELCAAKSGQASAIPAPVMEEVPAIVSHWLQSPEEDPIYLGPKVGAEWRQILASFSKRWPDGLNMLPKTRSETKSSGNADVVLTGRRGVRPRFKFIDLFAGIGGFRQALTHVGGRCVLSSEWDAAAKQTYCMNFGEVPFGDIHKFTESDGKPAVLGDAVPEHDILAGGFPCQAFSQAGKQRGFEDARGTLFFEVLKIAKLRKPKVLFLENVKRLRTHDHGNTFKVIVNSLREIGYKVYAKVLRSRDFGVPQNRERVFIVAFREPLLFEFPEPLSAAALKKVKLSNILEKDVDAKYTISDRLYEGHKRRLREHRENGNGFGFSVFSPDAPYVNTISARYYKDGSEILVEQPGKNPRKLTPRECARLQGFPDTFVYHPSEVQAYKQFGNSVSVPVVTAIASQIIKALDRNEMSKDNLLDPYAPVLF